MAKTFDVELLRYRGSGWLVDRALPKSPIGVIAVAVVLPLAWFAIGYALTTDRDAYLDTPDVIHQMWFLPLHILSMRIAGGLWADGLQPAFDGLGFDAGHQRRIRRGAFGIGASAGALLAGAYFIFRDITYGLTPNADGLTPFDNPDLWDFGALGHPVHMMMLGLWVFEWLFYGYLLWLQIWVLISWVLALLSTDFVPHLDRVLAEGGYKAAFNLFGKTATVCLVFALGNLLFTYKTGELIPREEVEINSVGDFLREMSDLVSVAALFVFALAGVVAFARVLRRALMMASVKVLNAAGGRAIAELGQPLVLTGDPAVDVERLHARVDAQGGMIHALALEREAQQVGAKAIGAIIAKSAVPLLTTGMKAKKLLGL